MKLLTLQDFNKNYFWLDHDLQPTQPTEEQQKQLLAKVAALAPKYFNTVYNPKNVSFDDKFGGLVVYLQSYSPGTMSWYFQAQLYVEYPHNGNYSLFSLTTGLTAEQQPWLVQNIAALAG